MHLPEALQRNISNFTQNILFTSSNIQDDLVSMQCLSEDECTDITSKANPKDQVRLLIRKMKSRGPESIEKFLKVVEKDKPELTEKVYKTLEEIISEYKDKPVCAICVMQNIVDLKDIADPLWEEKIISDNIFEDIISSNSLHHSQPLIWSSIMATLNDHPDHSKAKAILINALQPKYNHIVGYINQNPDRPWLQCWCCTKCKWLRRRPLHSEFGSQTDVSVSSSRIPKFLVKDDYESLSEGGLSSSQSLPSAEQFSYENPEVFDNIQSPQIDSTTYISSTFETETDNVNNREQFGSEADDKGDFSNFREEEPQKKQELKHSISTISNASTICPEISSSTPNTAGTNSNKFQNMFQLEMKKDNSSNDSTAQENDNVKQGMDDDEITKEIAHNKDHGIFVDNKVNTEINNDKYLHTGMDNGVAKETGDNKYLDIGDFGARKILGKNEIGNEVVVAKKDVGNENPDMDRDETREEVVYQDQVPGATRGKADDRDDEMRDGVGDSTDHVNSNGATRKVADNIDQGTDTDLKEGITDNEQKGMNDGIAVEIDDSTKSTDENVATDVASNIDQGTDTDLKEGIIDNEQKGMNDGIAVEIDDSTKSTDENVATDVASNIDQGTDTDLKEDITDKEQKGMNDGIAVETADSTKSTDENVATDIARNIDQRIDGMEECNVDVRRKENTNISLIPETKSEAIEKENISMTYQTRKHSETEESSARSKSSNLKLKIKGVNEDKHLEDENLISSTSHENDCHPEQATVPQNDTAELECSGGYTPTTASSEQTKKAMSKRARKREKRKQQKKQSQN